MFITDLRIYGFTEDVIKTNWSAFVTITLIRILARFA